MIRERLTPLGNAVLARLRRVPAWAPVARSFDRATGQARHGDLREELAAAYAEIHRLEARLGDATRKPTPVEEIRADDRAMRQRRLRIARGR